MTTTTTRAEASKRVVDETRRLYSGLLSQPLDDRQLARPSFKLIQEVAKNVSIMKSRENLRQADDL